MKKNLDYTGYSAEDFCQDPSFVQWVKMEDAQSTLFWESWVSQHPESTLEVNRARTIILGMGVVEPVVSRDRINLLKNRIDLKIDRQPVAQKNKHRFLRLKIAATVSILVITGALFFWFSRLPGTEDQQLVSSIQSIEKLTQAGEKSIFRLPDNTKIILNSNSKLSFPEEFSDSLRQVTLEGEAYFEVTKDSTRPFIINSGEVVTTVLGTSFNINAYPSSKFIKVAVSSGKVSVKGYQGNVQKSEWTITPNEMTVFQKDSYLMQKTSFDNLGEMGWKDGIIYFKDDGIEKIIATLSRWYGVQFVINKRINKTTDYSGIYENKSLEEVLKGIAFVFDFKYEINNKIVTIN